MVSWNWDCFILMWPHHKACLCYCHWKKLICINSSETSQNVSSLGYRVFYYIMVHLWCLLSLALHLAGKLLDNSAVETNLEWCTEFCPRGGAVLWDHVGIGQAEVRTGTLPLAGTRPSQPGMAQPQNRIWSVATYRRQMVSVETEGTRKLTCAWCCLCLRCC